MARYATSLGKGPKKKKRDNTRRASVRIEQRKDGDYNVTKRNDGDPTITSVDRDRRKTVRGPDKKVPTTSTYKYRKETAKSKGADLQWQSSPYTPKGGKPTSITNGAAYGGNRGEKYLPKRGTKGRPKKVTEEKTTVLKGSKMVPTKKPNTNYNKKKKASTSYSDKAKNPGGYPLGIPKTTKMTPAQKAAYKRYLDSK